MIALTVSLLLFSPCQDPDSLRDAWPELVKVWNELESHQQGKTEGFDDELLVTLGKLHTAFEQGGLLEKEPAYEVAALKQLFKKRFDIGVTKKSGIPLSGKSGTFSSITFLGGNISKKGVIYSFESLFGSIRKLNDLRERGLDDEDNVTDETVTIRKSLKALKITADETPMWLRRRVTTLTKALLMGEGYPEPVRASDAESAQVREWIGGLASEDVQTRDEAMRRLMKAGEAGRPQLRKALGDDDPEVVARVKRLLGIGHTPWNVDK